MKTTRTENELIIQETPGCLWAFSLLFLVVGGLFVYGSLGGFVNAGAVPLWTLLIAFLMGSAACAVGIRLINRSPITKIIINRDKEILTYITYGITGRTHALYHFDEIKEFSLIEENDSEGDPVWSLGMETSDGEIIKISTLESHDEIFKRNFVFQINEFMYKQMPSAQSVFQLEDES